MIKNSTFILFLISVFSFYSEGQTVLAVKQFFFDLPLDSSREELYNFLCKDRKFVRKDLDTNSSPFNLNRYTYLGASLEQAFVLAKADSVEIELTYGYSKFFGNKTNDSSDFASDLVLRLRYYFNSSNIVDLEYARLGNVLKRWFKDSSYTFTDTIFTDVPERRIFKAKGLIFSDDISCYTVELLKAKINPTCHGLFLEYVRKDE